MNKLIIAKKIIISVNNIKKTTIIGKFRVKNSITSFNIKKRCYSSLHKHCKYLIKWNNKQEFNFEKRPENSNLFTVNLDNNRWIERYSTTEEIPIKKLWILWFYLMFSKENSSWKKSLFNLLNYREKENYFFEDGHLCLKSHYGSRCFFHEGRLISKHKSIQTMPQSIRHFLFEDLYYDIDLKNSGPSIVLGIAKIVKRDVELPFLERYVYYRDDVLKEISNLTRFEKAEIKKAIIIIMNGGKTVLCGLSKNRVSEFIIGFKKDIKIATKIIVDSEMLDKGKKMYKVFLSQSMGKNIDGKYWHYLQGKVESTILISVTKYFSIKSWIPFHDGFYVKKKEIHEKFEKVENFLDKLNWWLDQIYGKHGCHLTFLIKPISLSNSEKLNDSDFNKANILYSLSWEEIDSSGWNMDDLKEKVFLSKEERKVFQKEFFFEKTSKLFEKNKT